MKRADSSFGCVVIGQGVLFPLAVADVSVESYVGMDGYSVVGQHSFVNTLPDRRCDRLRRRGIDEESSRLENEHDTRPEIPATALAIRGRRSDDEHLAALEGELPEGMIGSAVGSWIGVVVVKKLQDLPEASDERCVIRDGSVGLKERD